jgi:hypothetical protein
LKDFVLYCKSYSGDFWRLQRLLDSIVKFNVDQIPFYISTPIADKMLLNQVLGDQGYIWVADEDIVLANPRANLEKYKSMPGGLSQAIVKSEFWRLGFAENYLCLDSDSLFIRHFHESDFISGDGIPYTVLHQNKELFQTAANRGKGKVEKDLKAEAERVKEFFGRNGPNFYCAPSPFIWSARVWQSLDVECLLPKGMTLWDLIVPGFPETLTYGEALLKYEAIPLLAIEPLFRVYHYDWQYFLMKRIGETTEKLKANYLGVIYQSNWEGATNRQAKNKSLASRALRKVKFFLRYLESFIRKLLRLITD